MKLGIKTTDGVSKLKTKTTDGVTKAVECVCCNPCDSYALWGPGYDTKPETFDVLGHSVCRSEICEWVLSSCYFFDGSNDFYWSCGSECGFGDFYDFYIIFRREYFVGFVLEYFMPDFKALYIRTGGEYPFPYGIYTLARYYYPFTPEGPPTITISPP